MYSSQPSSTNVPSAWQALRMAVTSACAVGSLEAVTWLAPVAMTLPSFTMTAPNGPPRPLVTLVVARSMACCMNLGSP